MAFICLDDWINENLVEDLVNGSKFKGNALTRYGQEKKGDLLKCMRKSEMKTM